jgi:hypothetical protein
LQGIFIKVTSTGTCRWFTRDSSDVLIVPFELSK